MVTSKRVNIALAKGNAARKQLQIYKQQVKTDSTIISTQDSLISLVKIENKRLVNELIKTENSLIETTQSNKKLKKQNRFLKSIVGALVVGGIIILK